MMRLLLRFVLIAATIAGVASCSTGKVDPDFTDLSTIEGTWVMQFDESAVYEKWEKTSDTLYSGICYEISEGDSVLTETIQIISGSEGIFYIPVVSEQNNGMPVKFKLTSREGNIFHFENPDHDFPTRISYSFDSGNRMTAVVSGMVNEELRSLEFDYVRER
jgi:uncharacterized protein YtpQ (UPF0354 family)